MLSKKGYAIKKINNEANNKLINDLKKELTVSPHITFNKNIQPDVFPVYIEDTEYLYMPKYFGIKKYGLPSINNELLGESININFNGDLRDHQLNIINKILPKIETIDGGVLCLGCGEGKCLGINTPVMLYNGSTKLVQNIIIGDKLMGDDNAPRNVLSITTGTELMYQIIDKTSGEFYIVNKSHILSLKYGGDSDIYYNNNKYSYNDILDISVYEYINNKHELIDFYGYRLPILNLPLNKNIHDPFIYGKTLPINTRKLDYNYKLNSIYNRTELANGLLLNTDFTSVDNYGIYIISCNIDTLIEDFIWLFRSIGSTVFRLSDSKISLKYYTTLKNYDHLKYRFNIIKLEINNYFGFEIDNNKRFMLGDFTITHNTVLSLYIASLLKKKTLVIVHKEFLLNQWKQRASEFTDAKIGFIQRDKIDIDNKQIVIGMLQSIAKDKYSSDIFKDFGLVIFDEAHHAPSKYFSRALPIISCKKTLALSATPNRTDKLEKILYWYFGDILYKAPTELLNSVLVKIYKFNSTDKTFKEYKQNYGHDINRPKTITKLIELLPRNKLIINLIKELLLEEGRKLIVLSDRLEHLKIIKDSIDNLNVTSTSYYVGGSKQKVLDEAEKAQVIFATYSMASEGLDIPTLNTLLMITPRKEIEQAIGRITRKKDHLVQPLVIDIVDQLTTFNNQGNYRRKFYNKKQFKIKIYEVEEDNIINEISSDIIKKTDVETTDIEFLD